MEIDYPYTLADQDARARLDLLGPRLPRAAKYNLAASSAQANANKKRLNAPKR